MWYSWVLGTVPLVTRWDSGRGGQVPCPFSTSFQSPCAQLLLMDRLLFRSFTIGVAPCSCQCDCLCQKHLLALLIGGVLPSARCQADLTRRHSQSVQRADKCAKAQARREVQGPGRPVARATQTESKWPYRAALAAGALCAEYNSSIGPLAGFAFASPSPTVLFSRAQDTLLPRDNSTEGHRTFFLGFIFFLLRIV